MLEVRELYALNAGYWKSSTYALTLNAAVSHQQTGNLLP